MILDTILALIQAVTLVALGPVIIGALYYIIKYRTDITVILPYGVALSAALALMMIAFQTTNILLTTIAFILSVPGVFAFMWFIRYTIDVERRETID